MPIAEMFAFPRRHDVILCPADAQPALPHGASIRDGTFRGFSHTMAYIVAGWPAAVVRCGESAEGLPIAVQMVAAPWGRRYCAGRGGGTGAGLRGPEGPEDPLKQGLLEGGHDTT